MSKGKGLYEVVGRTGQVQHESAGQWDFLYSASTIKDPAHDVGDVVTIPGAPERSFVYANALSEVHSAHGCEFTYTGYLSYKAIAVAQIVGDREVTIAAATHTALTKDELKGGYVIIFDGSDDSDTTVRGIIGNDAAAADAAFKIYLDARLHAAVVAGTSASEVFRNPYAALKDGASASKPKAGLPAVNATAGQYFWVQKSGVCWVAPQGTVINNNQGVYWRHDGSIEAEIATGSKSAGVNSTQYAGHLLAGDYAGNGPLLNLRG